MASGRMLANIGQTWNISCQTSSDMRTLFSARCMASRIASLSITSLSPIWTRMGGHGAASGVAGKDDVARIADLGEQPPIGGQRIVQCCREGMSGREAVVRHIDARQA